MSFVDIILKKKDGQVLTADEIKIVAESAALLSQPVHEVMDYQMAALLMAICLKGMNAQETGELTLAMMKSGDTIDLGPVERVCVDKHSTGGVGDTTTLVLVPLVAACGGYVAKMSGRGLGHTGGTLDKLESIAGMSVSLDKEAFIAQVRDIGCAVIGQSDNLVPADKNLYALRDVTGTVDSIPLIASSILSKKFACGTNAIVLDVKTGTGALMQTVEESITLAQAMVDIGTHVQKQIVALVTGMDQPLGTHVGNALEVKEAIDILSGKVKGDLLEVSLVLGAHMLVASGVSSNEEHAREAQLQALRSGAGLRKLKEMISAQGGDARVCDDTALLPTARYIVPVTCEQDGYVAHMDTTQIGCVAQSLGAGRVKKEDVIDSAVGLVMAVRIGEHVKQGDALAYLHMNKKDNETLAAQQLREAIVIQKDKPSLARLVYATVTREGVKRA